VESRPALWLTKPPINWVAGVKKSGREADHTLPASSEVMKKTWIYTFIPPPCRRGAVIKEQLYLYPINVEGNAIISFYC
jgi:hypothetical protein